MPSCGIHPASKWFGYCVEGMKCLEGMGRTGEETVA